MTAIGGPFPVGWGGRWASYRHRTLLPEIGAEAARQRCTRPGILSE
jgi:hypothetical protein